MHVINLAVNQNGQAPPLIAMRLVVSVQKSQPAQAKQQTNCRTCRGRWGKTTGSTVGVGDGEAYWPSYILGMLHLPVEIKA